MGMRLSPDLRDKVFELAGVAAVESWPEHTPGPSKFGNVPVRHNGLFFQSTKEGDRFLVLKHDQTKGRISDLRTQVKFEFVVNGILIPQTYRADFVYLRDGLTVVEDAKGHKTDLYKLKKSLMLACHGIEILET